MAIALVLAFILYQGTVGRGAYRVVYFMPYIISVVAAATIFEWIFDANFGLLNYLLELVGIGAQAWLREPRGIFQMIGSAFGAPVPDALAGPSLSLVAVSIFTVWHFIGFQTVVFLAGLTNISREYYEAARIDGASERQIFRSITLPLLSPTIFFIAIIASVGAMRSFSQIYVLTNGGPLDTTRTVPLLIFHTFFERTAANGIGLGAAMSFIFVLIIIGITLVQFRVLGRRVFYQ
jgi:multiple sugar transport system permease protein